MLTTFSTLRTLTILNFDFNSRQTTNSHLSTILFSSRSSSAAIEPPHTMTRCAIFRAGKLDIGGFVNARVIRDHTKRKVFEKHEAERFVPVPVVPLIYLIPHPIRFSPPIIIPPLLLLNLSQSGLNANASRSSTAKPSATSSATPNSPNAPAPSHNCSSRRVTATSDRRR
jgi:hypothetical protein